MPRSQCRCWRPRSTAVGLIPHPRLPPRLPPRLLRSLSRHDVAPLLSRTHSAARDRRSKVSRRREGTVAASSSPTHPLPHRNAVALARRRTRAPSLMRSSRAVLMSRWCSCLPSTSRVDTLYLTPPSRLPPTDNVQPLAHVFGFSYPPLLLRTPWRLTGVVLVPVDAGYQPITHPVQPLRLFSLSLFTSISSASALATWQSSSSPSPTSTGPKPNPHAKTRPPSSVQALRRCSRMSRWSQNALVVWFCAGTTTRHRSESLHSRLHRRPTDSPDYPCLYRRLPSTGGPRYCPSSSRRCRIDQASTTPDEAIAATSQPIIMPPHIPVVDAVLPALPRVAHRSSGAGRRRPVAHPPSPTTVNPVPVALRSCFFAFLSFFASGIRALSGVGFAHRRLGSCPAVTTSLPGVVPLRMLVLVDVLVVLESRWSGHSFLPSWYHLRHLLGPQRYDRAVLHLALRGLPPSGGLSSRSWPSSRVRPIYCNLLSSLDFISYHLNIIRYPYGHFCVWNHVLLSPPPPSQVCIRNSV
uniref:Uncharacterized protein n=1 Tax=Mycena chlorophos TaxID=658473 RepID=A0ABQ0L7A0_MYCCL|nr:predicted protein [Mycena chlorophos]